MKTIRVLSVLVHISVVAAILGLLFLGTNTIFRYFFVLYYWSACIWGILKIDKNLYLRLPSAKVVIPNLLLMVFLLGILRGIAGWGTSPTGLDALVYNFLEEMGRFSLYYLGIHPLTTTVMWILAHPLPGHISSIYTGSFLLSFIVLLFYGYMLLRVMVKSKSVWNAYLIHIFVNFIQVRAYADTEREYTALLLLLTAMLIIGFFVHRWSLNDIPEDGSHQ